MQSDWMHWTEGHTTQLWHSLHPAGLQVREVEKTTAAEEPHHLGDSQGKGQSSQHRCSNPHPSRLAHQPEIDSSCELRGSARRTTARLYCCCCSAPPGKAVMRGAVPATLGDGALSGAGAALRGSSGSVTLNSFWPVSGRGSCHAAYAQLPPLPLPPLLPACDMVRLCVENSAVLLAAISQPQALRDLGLGGSSSPSADPFSTVGMRTVAVPCMKFDTVVSCMNAE